MSQLDLALAADVSPKHVSFLETSRAHPSREMLLRLANTLGLPLREQNALLASAGYSEVFHDSGPTPDATIERALRMMMEKHEPYPLLVFDRGYDIIMLNRATQSILGALLGTRASAERNVMKLLFDPTLLRLHVLDWDGVARAMLARLQREAILDRRDDRLRRLLSTLCCYEGVPADWRQPNLELQSDPTLNLRFRAEDRTLGFLTTVTVFSAPQNVSVEELHIESYYPLDAETEAFCRELADASSP